MVRRYERVVGSGRYTVCGAATVTDDGVIIELLGGEKPHVGAVAFAVPRPSVNDPDKTSASVTVVPRLGHHDDEIAKPAADRAARVLGVPVVVIAGIHISNAGSEDIRILVRNAEEALEKILPVLINPSDGMSALQSQHLR